MEEMPYQTEIRKLNTHKGWRKPGQKEDPLAFAAYIALAHSELSEALDAYRDKIWSEDRLPREDQVEEVPKPIGVGPELADVYIRLVDMADIWGINLQMEIRRVLEYGWTRPFQHGGRTF